MMTHARLKVQIVLLLKPYQRQVIGNSFVRSDKHVFCYVFGAFVLLGLEQRFGGKYLTKNAYSV